MKYKFSLSATAFFLFFLFYLSGCVKKDLHPSPPQGGNISCKISKIAYLSPDNGLVDTLTFTYNAFGNPTYIKQLSPDEGRHSLLFFYDNTNRLVQYKELYGDEYAAASWSLYQFANGSSRPYLDTTYDFPDPDTGSTPPAFFNGLFTTTYSYDAQGRLNQTVEKSTDGFFTDSATYLYNSSGNLTGNTYDDKINFLRTDPVLQFISRNYSQNNSLTNVVIDAYNTSGLPTHLKGSITFANSIAMNEAWIYYDCDLTSPVSKKP
jgi:hypothetical protein